MGGAMTKPLALRPLPVPPPGRTISGGVCVDYTAAEMHAYARQAQIDTLEAAAKVCEKRCVGDHNREDAEAIACAAAIRSLINF